MAAVKARVDERDRGLKRFFKRLRVFDGHEVVVGIPAKEGAETTEEGPTLAYIAAAHEFGGKNNRPPQRSFLRDTFDIHAKKYGDLMEKAAQRVVKGEDPRKALFVLGETARGDVILRINQGIPPELAASTIAAKTRAGKEGTLPLVDTGQLRASIRALVRRETSD